MFKTDGHATYRQLPGDVVRASSPLCRGLGHEDGWHRDTPQAPLCPGSTGFVPISDVFDESTDDSSDEVDEQMNEEDEMDAMAYLGCRPPAAVPFNRTSSAPLQRLGGPKPTAAQDLCWAVVEMAFLLCIIAILGYLVFQVCITYLLLCFCMCRDVIGLIVVVAQHIRKVACM